MAISIITFLTIFFSMSAVRTAEAGSSPPRFIQEVIARNGARIAGSRQLVFVAGGRKTSFSASVYLLENKGTEWKLKSPPFNAAIGEKGFAPLDNKREGDGKTPTGIFSLGMAFGYDASAATRMPYRQIMDDDFWVDDVNSEDYNRWVKGRPNAVSMEKMKRADGAYRYGIVIEYNTNPVVKGKGSAVFIHPWTGEGKATLGCVAMSEDRLLELLRWLDPGCKPMIVMGTEAELRNLRFQ